MEEFKNKFREGFIIILTSVVIAIIIGLIGESLALLYENFELVLLYLIIFLIIFCIIIIIVFFLRFTEPLEINDVFIGTLIYNNKEKRFLPSIYKSFYYFQSWAMNTLDEVTNKNKKIGENIWIEFTNADFRGKKIAHLIDYLICFCFAQCSHPFSTQNDSLDISKTNMRMWNTFISELLNGYQKDPSTQNSKFLETIPNNFKIKKEYNQIIFQKRFLKIKIKYDLLIISPVTSIVNRPIPSIFGVMLNSIGQTYTTKIIDLQYINFKFTFKGEFTLSRIKYIINRRSFIEDYENVQFDKDYFIDFFDYDRLREKSQIQLDNIFDLIKQIDYKIDLLSKEYSHANNDNLKKK